MHESTADLAFAHAFEAEFELREEPRDGVVGVETQLVVLRAREVEQATDPTDAVGSVGGVALCVEERRLGPG